MPGARNSSPHPPHSRGGGVSNIPPPREAKPTCTQTRTHARMHTQPNTQGQPLPWEWTRTPPRVWRAGRGTDRTGCTSRRSSRSTAGSTRVPAPLPDAPSAAPGAWPAVPMSLCIQGRWQSVRSGASPQADYPPNRCAWLKRRLSGNTAGSMTTRSFPPPPPISPPPLKEKLQGYGQIQIGWNSRGNLPCSQIVRIVGAKLTTNGR